MKTLETYEPVMMSPELENEATDTEQEDLLTPAEVAQLMNEMMPQIEIELETIIKEPAFLHGMEQAYELAGFLTLLENVGVERALAIDVYMKQQEMAQERALVNLQKELALELEQAKALDLMIKDDLM